MKASSNSLLLILKGRETFCKRSFVKGGEWRFLFSGCGGGDGGSSGERWSEPFSTTAKLAPIR